MGEKKSPAGEGGAKFNVLVRSVIVTPITASSSLLRCGMTLPLGFFGAYLIRAFRNLPDCATPESSWPPRLIPGHISGGVDARFIGAAVMGESCLARGSFLMTAG